ncbi:hypothetical protein ADK35_22920 [Streptomyces viridochromogenes]|nr:hypothetical protein ADK35_22920 [Streptomyces viridochromogenes]
MFDVADIHDRKGRRAVIAVGLQRWLAPAFAARTSNRSGVTRLSAAEGIYAVLSCPALQPGQRRPLRGSRWLTVLTRCPVAESLLHSREIQLPDVDNVRLAETAAPDVPPWERAAMDRVWNAAVKDNPGRRSRVPCRLGAQPPGPAAGQLLPSCGIVRAMR